jgi:hypothetical protein
MAPSNASSQSVISGVLRRIDRKVRLNRVLDHLSIALCLVMATLVTIELVSRVVAVATPSALVIVLIALVVYLAFFIWSQRAGQQLGIAAGVADSRGDLHDELKSAYWFMRQDFRTEWTDTQVARATETARNFPIKRLIPTEVPQRFWTALGLAAILVAFGFVPAGPPLLTFARMPIDTEHLTAEQETQLDDIRALVDEAQELEAEKPEDERLSEEAQQRIEEAMRRLEAEELSMEDLMRELREAQNSLEEGNLDMAAMQEALDELAADLESNEQLGEMADAMQNQNLADAAEMMRQLAQNLQNMDAEQLQEMADQLQQAAQGDQQSMQELMDALQQAAEAMSDQQMAEAQQAMEQAADAMQQMAQQMDAQQMMNAAAQQMQQMQQSMSQQQLAQQMQQMMQTDQTGGEQQQGAMAMPSDEVQKTAASGDSGDPSQQQGGPAGNATSDPVEGAEMQLGQATTLEVQLEMEVLDKEENQPEPEEPPDPEDLFQEASRQETAMVEYRSVRKPSSYAEGAALSVEQIPWRYRNLVKRYFLAIRPRENQ